MKIWDNLANMPPTIIVAAATLLATVIANCFQFIMLKAEMKRNLAAQREERNIIYGRDKRDARRESYEAALGTLGALKALAQRRNELPEFQKRISELEREAQLAVANAVVFRASELAASEKLRRSYDSFYSDPAGNSDVMFDIILKWACNDSENKEWA